MMKLALHWRAALALLALSCVAAGRDEPRHYPRTDPDNSGGERVGADSGEDGFTGYPADPGEPNDPYFDYMEEYAPYSPNWTGAFVGAGILVGPLSQYGTEFDDRVTDVSYGAFLNYSSVFEIVDLQVAYRRYTGDATHEERALHLTRDQASLSGLLHPFFIGLISGTKFGYTLGAIYGLGGFSYDWVQIDGDLSEDYQALGWHIGGGIDIPIDSPQDGNAIWIGLQFRQDHIMGDQADNFMHRRTIREDALLLRLTYRHNGNLLRTRVNGPTAP